MPYAARLLVIALFIVGIGVTLTGCVHGPRALRASHALHNEALRSRIDEELLLNIVRLRYRESPLFLQVGTVVTQFELSSSLGAGGTLGADGSDTADIDANVRWSEQPTYTFTPLQDDEFVRRLLTPIDLEIVMLLQRSGWSIERVLRLTAQNIGGYDNASSASGPTPDLAPDYREFLELARSLRRLQQQGRVQLGYEQRAVDLSAPVDSSSVLAADVISAAQNGYRFEPMAGLPSKLVLRGKEKVSVLNLSNPAEGDPELQKLVRMLRLVPGQSRYEIVVSAPVGDFADAGQRNTIGVSTRSLLGTFFYLSQGIDVPAIHVAEELVTLTRDARGETFDWRHLTGDIFRVKSSPDRPENSAIAVPYLDHWFYIDDDDLQSKSTFALLLELFNISAEARDSAAPTLTLPVGG